MSLSFERAREILRAARNGEKAPGGVVVTCYGLGPVRARNPARTPSAAVRMLPSKPALRHGARTERPRRAKLRLVGAARKEAMKAPGR
jgi:hypothetical protein